MLFLNVYMFLRFFHEFMSNWAPYSVENASAERGVNCSFKFVDNFLYMYVLEDF
jgi:hypothetical protein